MPYIGGLVRFGDHLAENFQIDFQILFKWKTFLLVSQKISSAHLVVGTVGTHSKGTEAG